MNLKTLTFLAFALLLAFAGCDSAEKGTTDIESFYFPVRKLVNGGKIYEYRPVANGEMQSADSLLSVYYKYEYFPSDTSPTLVTTQFDEFCRQTAIYRDEIVDNGILQKGVRLLSYDSLSSETPTAIEANVEIANVFLFEVKDSVEFVYKVSWGNLENSNGAYTLARKRKYKGMTGQMYKGKMYDCVEFDVTDRITVQQLNDGDFYQEFYKKERYAKGLGLVYFTIDYGDRVVEYELVDEIDMDDLIERCNQLFFNDY